MKPRLTTAQARRDFAKVLRTARRGTPVVVTSDGQPVAAVISIEQLRKLEQAQRGTLAEAIRTSRAILDEDDLRGPDPWSDVRDSSAGRDVELD